MASSLYKDYLVVTAADYNRDTSEWKPWVSICWRDSGRQHLHQIRFVHEKLKTALAAEEFGKNAAEKWVERQPGR